MAEPLRFPCPACDGSRIRVVPIDGQPDMRVPCAWCGGRGVVGHEKLGHYQRHSGRARGRR